VWGSSCQERTVSGLSYVCDEAEGRENPVKSILTHPTRLFNRSQGLGKRQMTGDAAERASGRRPTVKFLSVKGASTGRTFSSRGDNL